VLYITSLSLVQSLADHGNGGPARYGCRGLRPFWSSHPAAALFAVTGTEAGPPFALPGHIELIAGIFVLTCRLFASTALAPISFMPTCWVAKAALNPLRRYNRDSLPPTAPSFPVSRCPPRLPTAP